MSEDTEPYIVGRLENADTGPQGNIVILQQAPGKDNDGIYVSFDTAFDAKTPSDEPTNTELVPDDLTDKIEWETIGKARYAALQLRVKDAFFINVNKSMPLAWIAFTQLIILSILFSPGVIFVGSMYALVAQAFVIVAATMNNGPYVMTASRVATAVAIGNVFLAIVVWQASYNITDQVAAAYRAAVVVVVGFTMIVTNEYLVEVSTPSLEGANEA
jgi:hypothetical protein